jgi:hypothetical protein
MPPLGGARKKVAAKRPRFFVLCYLLNSPLGGRDKDRDTLSKIAVLPMLLASAGAAAAS